MADKDIYLSPTANIIQWGRRVYYYNCHRNGRDFAWHKDNLSAAKDSVQVGDITAAWVFKNKWQPQSL